MDNGSEEKPSEPRCMQEVIRRVGQGTSTKGDADYLLDTLTFANMRIREMERRIVMLQRRLATVH